MRAEPCLDPGFEPAGEPGCEPERDPGLEPAGEPAFDPFRELLDLILVTELPAIPERVVPNGKKCRKKNQNKGLIHILT